MQRKPDAPQIDWTPIRKSEKQVYRSRRAEAWFLVRTEGERALIESHDGKDLRWIYTSQIHGRQ